MLIEFSVENFLSIKNKITLSLLASKEKSYDYHLITSPPLKQKSLLKTTVIYASKRFLTALLLFRAILTLLYRSRPVNISRLLLDKLSIPQYALMVFWNRFFSIRSINLFFDESSSSKLPTVKLYSSVLTFMYWSLFAMGILFAAASYFLGFFIMALLFLGGDALGVFYMEPYWSSNYHNVINLLWKIIFTIVIFYKSNQRLAYPVRVFWFFRDYLGARLNTTESKLNMRMMEVMAAIRNLPGNKAFWESQIYLNGLFRLQTASALFPKRDDLRGRQRNHHLTLPV